MKTIYLFTFIAFAVGFPCSGQYSGKRFLEADGSVGFTTKKPVYYRSGDYSNSLSLSFGKFRTENRATVTRLWYAFNGSTSNQTRSNPLSNNGLNNFSVGLGRNWFFYKHLGKEWGIYGGPNAGLGFSRSRSVSSGNEDATETDMKSVVASLSLSAGAYYTLSDRWWLRASIGYSNFLNLNYEFTKKESIDNQGIQTGSDRSFQFYYAFKPELVLPSVGLGLTYFLK